MHEKILVKHCCRQKKRFLDRDRKHIRNAYMAYRMFYEAHYSKKRTPTRDQFEKSNVYEAFAKFGQYIEEVNAISPDSFITFAIASKRGVDKWCSDSLYMEYVRALTKVEDGERALERNIHLMVSWANQEPDRLYTDFFRAISIPLAVQWIMSGRISPWVIFNCDSGRELINRLSPEQFKLLERAIDIKFWMKNFDQRKSEVTLVQNFLNGEGM